MNPIEEKKKKNIERAVGVAALLIVGLIVAPYVFIAIKGLVGLGIAAGLSLGIWFSTPVIAKKASNWRLKAIKAEAQRNPVEELQNQYSKKEIALDKFKENIRAFTAQVLSFAQEVAQYVKDGLDDAPTYKEQLAKMRQLLELRNRKFQEAKEILAAFAETIKQTDRKWKMVCSAARMSEAAGEMEGDVFDKICIETALDSVQTKLNEAFADLEISLLDEDKGKAKVIYQQSLVTAQQTPDVSSARRQPIAVK